MIFRKVVAPACVITAILVFSFIFNFFWESLHAVYLYQKHDFEASKYIPMLLYVSSVDCMLVFGLYAVVGLLWWDFYWIKHLKRRQLVTFVCIGLGTAALVEHVAVFHHRNWAYKKVMPTLFGIGISPLLQLSVTGLIAIWLTRELLYGKGLMKGGC
jgi:hypothetical protein